MLQESPIEGTGAESRRRTPLESLLSAICNYGQAEYGWLALSSRWVEQRQGYS